MGRRLGALLGNTFEASKFKTLLNLAISRLAVLKNQRQGQCNRWQPTPNGCIRFLHPFFMFNATIDIQLQMGMYDFSIRFFMQVSVERSKNINTHVALFLSFFSSVFLSLRWSMSSRSRTCLTPLSWWNVTATFSLNWSPSSKTKSCFFYFLWF